MSVISLTYSICLLYKIWNLRTSYFLDSKAIAHCDFCSVSSKLNFFFLVTCASNARIDRMSVISLTYFFCVWFT